MFWQDSLKSQSACDKKPSDKKKDDPLFSYDWVDAGGNALYNMEILAPATASTYKYAVNAGANAIYFGYGDLNARAGADNFTSSLKEVVDYCHFYNVKAFLTLNICLKDEELKEAEQVIIEAEKAGIDAFIIADLSLIPIIKKHSAAQLHASTQLGIHNSFGLQWAAAMGFDRVVLSREMTRTEINDVGLYTPVDLEFFIHGALCIGFSGACLLSSMLTGNSGNRGRCNQLCRKFYRSYIDGKEAARGYLLSAKDICMAGCLDKIAGGCIRSGKIEGRMRRAEYIAGTTNYYNCLKRSLRCDVSDDDLKVLFNRGDFTEGYFNGKDVVYPYSPAHIGRTVGQVVKVVDKHIGFVRCFSPLKKENGYKVMRRDREVAGCTATGNYKDGYSVVYCSEELKAGDSIHLTSDIDLKNRVLSLKRPRFIDYEVYLVAGQKPEVHVWHKDKSLTCDFDFTVEKAKNQPLTKEDVQEHFSKTGDSGFTVRHIYTKVEDAFLTKAQLNEIRRKMIELSVKLLMDAYERETAKQDIKPAETVERHRGDFAEIADIDDLSAKLLEYIPNIVYAPEKFNVDDCREFYEKAKRANNYIWVKLPPYVSQNIAYTCEKIISIFDGAVCNNVGTVAMAKDCHRMAVAGPSLNIFNTKNPLISACENYFLSTELNRNEIKRFDGGLIYAYGYLPLMYLTFCPRHQAGISCENCYGKIELRDEKGSYLVTTTKLGKGRCMHALRNSCLTDVGNDIGKELYFDFTVRDEKIDDVLTRYYESGLYSPIGTNKLHLTRGVK